MEKLKRELDEKMAEMMRIKGTLQSSEMVSCRLIHHLVVFRDVPYSEAQGMLHISGFSTAICLFWLSSSFSLFLCQTSEQMSSSMTALQAEKERLMRSVSEREAELSSLKQTATLQQSSLQQERERSSREMVELQGKLQEKVSRHQWLR